MNNSLTDIAIAVALFTVSGGLLTAMALQDYESSSVSGELCLLTWVAIVGNLVATCLYYKESMSVTRIVLCVACAVFFYLPVECGFFGDADILSFAMAASLLLTPSRLGYLTMFLVSTLLAIPLYLYFYQRKTGVKWVLGAGMMVPALPIFAIGWWLCGIEILVLYCVRCFA